MFIYREEYYLSRTEPSIDEHDKYAAWQDKCGRAHNVAEVIVAKQRHGPIGTVKLKFEGNRTRFSDADQAQSAYGDD